MSAREPRSPQSLAAVFGRGEATPTLAPVATITTTPKQTLTPVPDKTSTPRAPRQTAVARSVPTPEARERYVYAALDSATVDALREQVQATNKSQITLLGEAIDSLTPGLLEPHLPQRTTTSMPGARASAVAIKGSNFNIRASAQQHEWIRTRHEELAPDLSMRQFLGIALTHYLEHNN
jgi:hypothetical protein